MIGQNNLGKRNSFIYNVKIHKDGVLIYMALQLHLILISNALNIWSEKKLLWELCVCVYLYAAI